MEPFLRRSFKYISNLQSLKSLHVVLGNESCDLDSAVCALTYAYYLNYTVNNPTIPVLNILKHEFPLKTELVYVLKQFNISSDNLIFRDSLDLNSITCVPLQITLVDHHVMSISWQHLSSKVICIYDHRVKDLNWHWSESVRMVIELVGSCATLIAREILNSSPMPIDKESAKMLYDTIVLDTVNFSKSANRVTKVDLDIAASLEENLEFSPQTITTRRTNIFDTLIKARTDISNLTPLQLLYKDLKLAGCIPVPGLPILVKNYLQMTGSEEAIKYFCNNHKATIVVIMGIQIESDVVTRDFAIYHNNNSEIYEELKLALLTSEDPSLLLTVHTTPIKDLELFIQGNNKASRKHIYPIIKQVADSF